MANIRLFGLVLIITSLMLGMAAVTTQTTTIRIGDTGFLGDLEKPDRGNYDNQGVQFITVPVAYPLVAACCLGLVLWFLPELGGPRKSAQLVNVRRRRRKR